MSSENSSTSSGSKKKKIAASAIAVALAAVLMIGGTISYLQASSEEVVNEFDTNDIEVDIEETGDGDYNIIPGTSEDKDPTVKLTTSVDAYVFLVVEDDTDGLVEYEIDTNVWTLLEIENCMFCDDDYSCSENCVCVPWTGTIYYTKVSKSNEKISLNVLVNQTVSYASDLTNEDMYDYTTTMDEDGNETTTATLKNGVTLSFKAYAIQQASFEVYTTSTDGEGNETETLDVEASALKAFVDGVIYMVLEDEGWTLVSTAEELKEALSSGGNIAVTADIEGKLTDSGILNTMAYTFTVSSDTTLFLGDNTISFDLDDVDESTLENGSLVGVPVLIGVTGGSLTIMGGTVDASAGLNTAYPVVVNGPDASVTLNCGTYVGASHVVYVYEGSATINCGHFEFVDAWESYMMDNAPFKNDLSHYLGFMLNCYDSNWSTNTAGIVVYGGSYVNFNPANNVAEGNETSFVADGYTVTSSTNDDGDMVYTVVKKTSSEEDSSSEEE